MARFRLEQAAAVAAIHQVINEWAREVDVNFGRSIEQVDVFTSDAQCSSSGRWYRGLAQIADGYRTRSAQAEAGSGIPVIRQLNTNFRIFFTSKKEAKVEFQLFLFVKLGQVPFDDYCDPVEVADVHVECREDNDGHWRISKLNADRIFRHD